MILREKLSVHTCQSMVENHVAHASYCSPRSRKDWLCLRAAIALREHNGRKFLGGRSSLLSAFTPRACPPPASYADVHVMKLRCTAPMLRKHGDWECNLQIMCLCNVCMPKILKSALTGCSSMRMPLRGPDWLVVVAVPSYQSSNWCMHN